MDLDVEDSEFVIFYDQYVRSYGNLIGQGEKKTGWSRLIGKANFFATTMT